jgi:hypothetical protein
MTASALRVLTVLARHGNATYANALPDIRAVFARMSDVRHHVLVVDNALPPGHVERIEPGVELIGSLNAAWEFSAWDAGIAHLGRRIDAYDIVNLVTSAFRQLDVSHLDHVDHAMLARLRGRAAALGHIDCYNEPVTLLGSACQSWIRSSFVCLAPSNLAHLGTVTSVTERAAFFSGDPQAPFRADAPISESYRRYILGWLTGDGTGQGTQWHSRFELTEETLSLFESKTLAILNEQMLTNRLRAQGCATVDVTWLAAQLRGPGGPGPIPDWRVQLAARD